MRNYFQLKLKHVVILIKMKDDNTTGSFWLCHLFYMLSMIMISEHISTRMDLYAMVKCTYKYVSMFTIDCYLCSVSLAGVYHYWYESICILCNYGCNHVTFHLLIIAVDPHPYNIVRHDFCVSVWCLYENQVSLIVWRCQWSAALCIYASCTKW